MACLTSLLNVRESDSLCSWRTREPLSPASRPRAPGRVGMQHYAASHLNGRHVAASSSDVTAVSTNLPGRLGHSERVRAVQASSRVYHLQRFSDTVCDSSLGREKLFHLALKSCLAIASGTHSPGSGKADLLKRFPAAGSCQKKVNNSSRQC